MGDWTKVYEALTKPLPAVSALFLILASSILLFSPPQFTNFLGLAILAGTYRWVPGVLFLIGVCWLVIIIAVPASRRLYHFWEDHQRQQRLRERLSSLTNDESTLLNQYLANNSRSWPVNVWDQGTAQGLVDDGILYRPNVGQAIAGNIHYNITQEALDILIALRQASKP